MLKKYWFLVFGVCAIIVCVSSNLHTAPGDSSQSTSPINLRNASGHGDDVQHSVASDANQYSPDDVLTALKPTKRQPSTHEDDASSSSTLLPLNGLSQALPSTADSFSYFFGPFDSTTFRQVMTGPLRSLTRLFSAPFSLIMNSGVTDGSEVPPLGDVLNDLSVASLTAETLYQGLAVFQTMLELPFAFFAHTVGQPAEKLTGLGIMGNTPSSADLKSQGVLGFLGMVDTTRRLLAATPDGAENPATTTQKPTGTQKPLSTLFGLPLPTADYIGEHRRRADELAGNLDVLTMLMSGGLVNPLMFGLNGIADAVKHLIQVPTDALSWFGLANYLQFTEDMLRRMKTNWNLTPDQSVAVDGAIEDLHRLLSSIGSQFATIGAAFLSEMSEELQHLSDALRSLNGTQLTPVLQLHGLDVSNVLRPRHLEATNSDDSAADSQNIQFQLGPADFLMNAFGFPLQVVDALARQAPLEISGLPLFNVTDISPVSLFGSLADYGTRMMDVRRILAIVLDGLPTNNNGTTANDSNSTSGVDSLLFSKTLLLSNAISLTTDLISRLSKTPLALFSVFSDEVEALAQLPMAFLNALDPFAPTLPSNLPFNFLFPMTPSAQEQRRRLEDMTIKTETTPGTTHQRLQAGAWRSGAAGETAYKNQLLADQRVLKSAVSQMMRSRQTECDPHVAFKQETLKSQALAGNPKRMLDDAGVTNAQATDVLTGKTDHKKVVASHHRTGAAMEHNHAHMSPESAVELCEIKKGAVESVHTFSQKLADLAGNLGKLAHATTIVEARDTETLIHTQLSGLDVPPPPVNP